MRYLQMDLLDELNNAGDDYDDDSELHNVREEGNNHEKIKCACSPIANSTHLVESKFSVFHMIIRQNHFGSKGKKTDIQLVFLACIARKVSFFLHSLHVSF